MSTAREQAIAQVSSISAMVAALDLDYDRLEELRDELEDIVAEGDDAALVAWHKENGAEYEDLTDALYDGCASREDVEQRIQEHPLSVEVRSGWHSSPSELCPEEFRIVLCTGGPHVELQGDLDRYGQPDRVRVIFKDWGESGELFDFDHDAVLTYCQQFYFGE